MISLKEMMDYLFSLKFDIKDFTGDLYRFFGGEMYRYRDIFGFGIAIIKIRPSKLKSLYVNFEETQKVIILPDESFYHEFNSIDETSFILSYSNYSQIRELMMERKDVFDVFMEISDGKFN